VSFNVPIDEVQKLSFSVGVERDGRPSGGPTTRRRAVGAAGGSSSMTSEAMPVTLTLLSEPGTLKLVRGFYVIVPLFENDGEPRWSAYALQRIEGRWMLVDGAGKTAPFEHFVLRIDYAS
jgi:hypothetical protein